MAAVYHTEFRTLRNSFLALADTLTDVAEPGLSDFYVDICIQVVAHSDSDPEPGRTATVDRLAAVLAPGEPTGAKGRITQYGTPVMGVHRYGVDLTVFTPIESAEQVRLRAENEALRAELAVAESKAGFDAADH
jgi:hypothetical protein